MNDGAEPEDTGLAQRSAAWFAARERCTFTASELGAACGVSPNETRAALWRRRFGGQPSPRTYVSSAMQYGVEHESDARDMLQRLLGGVRIDEAPLWRRRSLSSPGVLVGASPDGLLHGCLLGGNADGETVGVELKCITPARVKRGNSDLGPEAHHVLQCYTNMWVLGVRTYILAYWSERTMRVFLLRWHEDLWLYAWRRVLDLAASSCAPPWQAPGATASARARILRCAAPTELRE